MKSGRFDICSVHYLMGEGGVGRGEVGRRRGEGEE